MAERVLVAGATGGVGQLVTARLLEAAYTVRVLTRNSEKAAQMFDNRVELAIGDTLDPATLTQAMENIDYLICCTGTTAFPSPKWNFAFAQSGLALLEWGRVFFDTDYRRTQARNSPQQVDAEGITNLVKAAPAALKRFVFVSSCGVERKDQPPYNILNAFGVLDAKQQGETAITQSGLPYTIIRPGRLIDGPFTSSDLNTLLRATTNGKQGVILGKGDQLTGQTSRIDVAAACVESLRYSSTVNQIFEIINQGDRPERIDWRQLFEQLVS